MRKTVHTYYLEDMVHLAPKVADIAQAASMAAGLPIQAGTAFRIGDALWGMSFTLNNGIRFILAPDGRAPIFAYQSWFRVGSRDEDPKRTGLAHLFEHLMFKGTSRFPTGTFDTEMERRGAQTNAATWVDWTHYTQALSTRQDNLDKVIEFESDRMVNLILDDETFASELEVVKNERRLSVEDSVGGQLSEALMDEAYKAHPYRWPTIGSMAHLEAASVDDLRAFYRRHYAPNNATVVLVGDIDPTEALIKLARAYGPLEAQPLAQRNYPKEPEQTEQRMRRFTRPMMAAQMVVGYHVPHQGCREHHALEMLTEILTGGDTGRLNEALVTEARVASEISGFLTPFADPGLLELHCTLAPHATADQVLELLHQEVARIADGIREHELAKARFGLTLELYDSLKDVEGLAEALGHHQTTLGDASLLTQGEAMYQTIDAEFLMACAARYLQPQNATVVVAEPPSAQEPA